MLRQRLRNGARARRSSSRTSTPGSRCLSRSPRSCSGICRASRGSVIASVGHRVSEPEVKFVFLVLFLLGGLAQVAKSEAVLPAYLVGLVIAGRVRARQGAASIACARSRSRSSRRSISSRRGCSCRRRPWWRHGADRRLPRGRRWVAKYLGIRPVTRVFRFDTRGRQYTTLLMSTGLTFGTISALFGLTNHIISQRQYTMLVTAVIGSAVVPTLIAQRFFAPEPLPQTLTALKTVPIIEEASKLPDPGCRSSTSSLALNCSAEPRSTRRAAENCRDFGGGGAEVGVSTNSPRNPLREPPRPPAAPRCGYSVLRASACSAAPRCGYSTPIVSPTPASATGTRVPGSPRAAPAPRTA